MKVILCENVPNLGEMGTTVKVAPGYARNFLLPRKLAVPAESGSAKQIEHEMRNIKRREEKVRVQLAEEAKKLGNISIDIKAKAGEEGKIFGSVTNVQIAEALKPLGYTVDRKSIHIELMEKGTIAALRQRVVDHIRVNRRIRKLGVVVVEHPRLVIASGLKADQFTTAWALLCNQGGAVQQRVSDVVLMKRELDTTSIDQHVRTFPLEMTA